MAHVQGKEGIKCIMVVMARPDRIVDVVRLPHAVDLPKYATSGSAGMDLLAAVDMDLCMPPGGRALIPTGVCVSVPHGHELQIRPRSGLALKHGIVVANSPGTIDEDYRGEVQVILMNAGHKMFVVRRGDRIAQAVLSPVVRVVWHGVEVLSETERGAGGFGSTGS